MAGRAQPKRPSLSYLICTVQRTGSWLLCHALQDTGMAGVPAEYFHRSDEPFWSSRWGVAGDAAFFDAMLTEATTSNGVFGSKMMWNYFGEAIERLRALRPGGSSDADVLARTLPSLHYVWLRRRDKLRQAVSWWRAGATGQYAVAGDTRPLRAPAYDREAIAALLHMSEECDASWASWFAAQGIVPHEIVYEDMVQDLRGTSLEVLAFLGIDPPADLTITPRMKRQADEQTETIVARFLAENPAS